MSRALSQQGESEQIQIKMQMLESNILRVISQNKRLQNLLEYSEHFPKLRQYTSQVALNWQKLNNLIIQINEIDNEIKKDREAIHTNINHHYQHINKNIVNQIKNYKITIRQYEEKISQINNKQKLIIKKNFQKIKQKYVNHIKFLQSKILGVISSAEKQFVESFNKDIVPHLLDKIQSQFQFNQIQCRTQIGHIQNLLSYYSSSNKLQSKNESQDFHSQIQYKQMKNKAVQVLYKNTQKMEQIASKMDLKLKGIAGEINWLQNKRRKQRRANTKQSERLNTNSQDYTENQKIIEAYYEVDELQNQLMGLGRYCDKIEFRRKLISNNLKEKGQGQLQSFIQDRDQKRLLSLNQKIVQFRQKIQQYSFFYKHEGF